MRGMVSACVHLAAYLLPSARHVYYYSITYLAMDGAGLIQLLALGVRMQQWKTLSRKSVLQYGRYLTVEEHVVELPDGTRIEDWSWVDTPDFINAIVVDEAGLFLMFRQVKYAVEGTTLAPVGGYIEPGEDPLVAAKREVLEEIGYEADHWVDLGSYACDANRGAGTGYLFLATGARHVAQPNSDDLEEQELLHLTKNEVRQQLLKGAFKVMPWSAAVGLALLYLDTVAE